METGEAEGEGTQELQVHKPRGDPVLAPSASGLLRLCALFPTALPRSALGEGSSPGGIVELSWAGCSCTVVPAAGQSLSPSGVSVPDLGSQAPVGVGSRAGFMPRAELVADS